MTPAQPNQSAASARDYCSGFYTAPLDGAPDAAAAPRWVLPDNFRDVTAERVGERIALIGPPMRAKPKD